MATNTTVTTKDFPARLYIWLTKGEEGKYFFAEELPRACGSLDGDRLVGTYNLEKIQKAVTTVTLA